MKNSRLSLGLWGGGRKEKNDQNWTVFPHPLPLILPPRKHQKIS